MALKDTYFTISEAAKELGVTRQTVSRWIATGQISTERIGRETLIAKHELKEYQHERILISVATEITEKLIEIIREKYNYSDQDVVQFVSFDRKKTHSFIVTRQDGTREKVLIDIRRAQVLSRNKGDPFLMLGYKVPIDKIVKKPCKKKRGGNQ